MAQGLAMLTYHLFSRATKPIEKNAKQGSASPFSLFKWMLNLTFPNLILILKRDIL
jgi:hypothetical protein|tara:strand:+ start:259 stop:426 length:168 start_codon:yes stop_codon:yes gene_type:complete